MFAFFALTIQFFMQYLAGWERPHKTKAIGIYLERYSELHCVAYSTPWRPFSPCLPFHIKNGSHTITTGTYNSVGWKWAVDRDSCDM